MTTALAALIVTLLVPVGAQALTPGWLDATYGGDFNFGLDAGPIPAGTVDASGRVLVATVEGLVVTRLTVDGAIDAGFGVGGSVGLPAGPSYERMLAGSDGIYVAGRPASGQGLRIARLSDGGVLDASYGNAGLASVSIPATITDVIGLTQLDSGDVVVAAEHSSAALRVGYLAAVTSSGALDPTWNAAGSTPGVRTVPDHLVGVAHDGNLTAAVGLSTTGGTRVRRYAANGIPDGSFASSGVLDVPAPFQASGINVGSVDGKYYVAGSSSASAGAPLSVARVLPTPGGLDPAFGVSGVAVAPGTFAPGVITATFGSFVYVFGYGPQIVRLSSSGVADLSFGTGGVLAGFPPLNVNARLAGWLSGGVQPSGKAVTLYRTSDADAFQLPRAVRVTTISAAPPAAGSFVAMSPTRVLDTRTGTGAPKAAVGPGAAISLPVGVGASAVVLTVTAVAPTRGGFVTVFPSGTTRPTASNVNHPAGQTTPNLVTVPTGTDGRVWLYNGSAGSTQLLADLLGYYVGGSASVPGAFVSLPPARILDTRNGTGAPLGRVPAGGTLTLTVGGAGGVPNTGASSVVVNATVAGQTQSGYLTIYPAGSTRPVVSNLNFTAGIPRANLATVPLGSGGALSLYNASSAPVDLIADVAGYYLGGAPTVPGTFVSLAPNRILDTRTPSPHPIASHASLVVPPPGIPAHAALVLNATVTGASAAGFATFHGGTAQGPINVSTLNFVAGQTTASLTVTAGSGFVVYNGSRGTIHVIADLAGYFLP